MRINEIIKTMRNEKRLRRGMNWLKTTLFQEYKIITEEICFENLIFNKEGMVYTHNFIADNDITTITETIIKEAKETMRKTIKEKQK